MNGKKKKSMETIKKRVCQIRSPNAIRQRAGQQREQEFSGAKSNERVARAIVGLRVLAEDAVQKHIGQPVVYLSRRCFCFVIAIVVVGIVVGVMVVVGE